MSIVVVGSSNTDMVVKGERIPVPGETVIGGEFVMVAGGKGANQAVAAARLGGRVTLIARVGTDVFGQQAVAGYENEGIDVSWIVRDPERATGVALILVDAKGENSISVASGANLALSPKDVAKAEGVIQAAKIVVMQLETPLDTIRFTAELAAKHGVPVLLDPAPAPDGPLPDDVLQNLTYLKPNETEASRLTGITVSDDVSASRAAAELLRTAPSLHGVIITLGKAGCYYATRDGAQAVIPSQIVKAVDTTAAGDAFSGALAVALSRGDLLGDAILFATRAASLSVQRLGAQSSLPRLDEIY